MGRSILLLGALAAVAVGAADFPLMVTVGTAPPQGFELRLYKADGGVAWEARGVEPGRAFVNVTVDDPPGFDGARYRLVVAPGKHHPGCERSFRVKPETSMVSFRVTHTGGGCLLSKPLHSELIGRPVGDFPPHVVPR